MKNFRGFLAVAAFVATMLPLTSQAQRRDRDYDVEKPAKAKATPTQLSIQDVDFTPVVVNTGNGKSDTVRVDVLWQRDQFKSIENKNFQIEIRFYSGKEKGQAKRIMKSKDYHVDQRVKSFTLSPSEACPAAGEYWAKVWFSIRNKDDSRNNSYDDYEEFYQYTCLDRARIQSIQAKSDFKLADQVEGSKYSYNSLNLLVDMNDKQYNQVVQLGGKVEVRLYSIRDDHLYRVGKTKPKFLQNGGKNSFSFKIKDLCGDMSGILDAIFGKEVEVTCRLSVVNANGNRNERFEEFVCPTEKFLCE